jgi:membrane-associated protease RseP (regulator of RpoE activity)
MLAYFFLIALGGIVVISIHEVAHLVAARSCGFRVSRLSVGFGPELVGLTDRHGTRWALAMLPLGAYLNVCFDHPAVPIHSVRRKMLMRIGILAAGPLANALFAYGIVVVCLATYGKGGLVPSLEYGQPVVFVASFVSGFSMFVALFNLLPIPPLDGGFMFLHVIEALSKKQISERVQRQLCAVGMTLMMMVTISIFLLMIKELG